MFRSRCEVNKSYMIRRIDELLCGDDYTYTIDGNTIKIKAGNTVITLDKWSCEEEVTYGRHETDLTVCRNPSLRFPRPPYFEKEFEEYKNFLTILSED